MHLVNPIHTHTHTRTHTHACTNTHTHTHTHTHNKINTHTHTHTPHHTTPHTKQNTKVVFPPTHLCDLLPEMWVVLDDAEVTWPLSHPIMPQAHETTVHDQHFEVPALTNYPCGHTACYVFLSTGPKQHLLIICNITVVFLLPDRTLATHAHNL